VLGWDAALEAIDARQVIALSRGLGLRLELIEPCGLAIANHSGWAVFDIGVECSAILEMAAFAGLVGFYPAFGAARKVIVIILGVAATYVLNLGRILLIAAIIDTGGTDWVFYAHAVIGRVAFFAGVIVIFWYLVTRPTIAVVSGRLKAVDG
jgi:exosortase family protein XrtG